MSVKDDENFAKAMEAFYRKRGYSDLERVRAALEAYFPGAIAETVAAEMERCIEICRQIASKEFGDANKSDAITALMCAEAIRSAAK